MAARRRIDNEEYVAATAVAREVRAAVAESAAKLIQTYDRMSSPAEVTARIERVNFCGRRLRQAVAQESQARVHGLPVARFVRDQVEFRELLRESVMALCVAAGGWVAALDYEKARVEEVE